MSHLTPKQQMAFIKSGVMNPANSSNSKTTRPVTIKDRLDFSQINLNIENKKGILDKMSRPKSTYHEHMFNTLHHEKIRPSCNLLFKYVLT